MTEKNEEKMTEKNLDLDESLKYYQLIRDYIIHEDTLINNRLSWLLTIQGLLFAAYGYSIREISRTDDLNSLIHLLKILGLCTSFFGFTGICSAALAIKQLLKKYKQYKKDYPLLKNLPDVTGGGYQFVTILGSFTPLGIPLLFLIVWLILLT